MGKTTVAPASMPRVNRASGSGPDWRGPPRGPGAWTRGTVLSQEIGKGHELELTVVFDQLVEQHLFALVVDVVVARSVHDQEVALQVFRIGKRVTLEVGVAILRQDAHETLFVDGVIDQLVGDNDKYRQ